MLKALKFYVHIVFQIACNVRIITVILAIGFYHSVFEVFGFSFAFNKYRVLGNYILKLSRPEKLYWS